jgi:predicted ATP-dependent endonuclease of OLD family
MNIGIDLDGTITEMPQLFAVLTNALIATGNKVHIITYRDDTKEEIAKELEDFGVSFTEIWLPNKDVNPVAWKRELAKVLDLDMMFEDSPEVLDGMPEKVKRIWICNQEIFNLKICIAALKADTRIALIE